MEILIFRNRKRILSGTKTRIFFVGYLLACFVYSITSLHAAALTESTIQAGNPEDWNVTGPAAVAAKLVAAAQKIKGVLPLEVKYTFRKDQNDYVFLERYVPLPGKPKKMKANIFGDNSGITIRMNFNDSSGELFQALIAKVDWEGWKEIETDLDFPIHWGGDNNGQMDGEVFFHSWVFNNESDALKTQGALGLSNLILYSQAAVQRGEQVVLGRAVRVTIDDFERANPLSVYQTWRGDDSTIESVSSTEFKKEGNFSMQVNYRLVTSRSAPSWVSLSFVPERAMDWKNVEDIKLWFRGDGSRNVLQITLVDDENKVWIYKEEGALKNVDWNQITIPISNFLSYPERESMKPGKITKYELSIVGEVSQISSGRVWFDELSTIGQDLDPLVVAPRPAVTPETVEKTKINLGDFLHLEYRHTPELNYQFLFYNSLYIRGTAKKLSLAADIVSKQNEAGTSIAFKNVSSGQKSAQTDIAENRTPVEIAYINTSIHSIHPNLSNVTVGNVTIDYGRDAFSPIFGFKGIQAEGGVSAVHYDTFILKHAFDSVTFGFRFQANPLDTLMKVMMVRHRDTARATANAQIQNGQLVIPSDIEVKTETIGNDTVYLIETDRNFFSGQMNLSGNYSIEFFDREAVKDLSDPFNPLFKNKLQNPESLYGRMWQVKMRLTPKVVNKGFNFQVGYRDLSTEFKPRFRFSPAYYDDFFADQRGVKFELTQVVHPFKLYAEYDDVKRGHDDGNYFRRFFQGSFGYYGWNKLDIVFSYNRRREFYALADNHLRSTFFIDPNDPRNEEANVFEIFLGNWFTSSFYIWCKLRHDNILLFNSNRRLRHDSVQVQGEYALFNNAKLNLSVIQTRFSDKSVEPFGGDPPGDNVVRMSLDINF